MQLDDLPTALLCRIFNELSGSDVALLSSIDGSHHIRIAANEVSTEPDAPVAPSTPQVLSTRQTCDIRARSQLHVLDTALAHCTSLRRLLVSCDTPLHRLLLGLEHAAPRLTHLKLCYAKDVSLARVAQVCPTLTHLWLEHSTIDGGCPARAACAYMPLQHLELFYCQVHHGSLDDVVRCV